MSNGSGTNKLAIVGGIIGIVVAFISTNIAVAGFTEARVERSMEQSTIDMASNAAKKAQAALDKIQIPPNGLDYRVTVLEGLVREANNQREDIRTAQKEMKADIKEVLRLLQTHSAASR